MRRLSEQLDNGFSFSPIQSPTRSTLHTPLRSLGDISRVYDLSFADEQRSRHDDSRLPALMAKLSLILILCASLVFSSVVYANANLLENHRRHGMIRKRAPQLGGIFAEASPAESSAAAQSTDASPANNSPTPTPSSSAQLATPSAAVSFTSHPRRPKADFLVPKSLRRPLVVGF